MSKSIFIKDNNEWKKVKNVWIKINGVWKSKIVPRGNILGNWKEFMQYMYDYIYYAYSARIVKLKQNNLTIKYDKTFEHGEGGKHFICSQAIDKEGNIYIASRLTQSEELYEITISKFSENGERIFYIASEKCYSSWSYARLFTKKNLLFNFINGFHESGDIRCQCLTKNREKIFSYDANIGGAKPRGANVVHVHDDIFLMFPIYGIYDKDEYEKITVYEVSSKYGKRLLSNGIKIQRINNTLIKKVNNFVPIVSREPVWIQNANNSYKVCIWIYDITTNNFLQRVIVNDGENWNISNTDCEFIWIKQIEYLDNHIYLHIKESKDGKHSRERYIIKLSMDGKIIKTQKVNKDYLVMKSQGEYIYCLSTIINYHNCFIEQYDKDLNLVNTRYINDVGDGGVNDILTTYDFEMEDLNI